MVPQLGLGDYELFDRLVHPLQSQLGLGLQPLALRNVDDSVCAAFREEFLDELTYAGFLAAIA